MTDALTLSQVPRAFSSMGEKHNQIVALLKTMTGNNGAKVVVADGKIIVELDPTANVTFARITATDGFVGNLGGNADTATTAGYADSAGTSTTASFATNAGTATTASFANSSTTANYAITAGYVVTAGSATTAGYAVTAGWAITAGYSITAEYAITAGWAITAADAITAQYAITAGYVITASAVSYWDGTSRINVDAAGAVFRRESNLAAVTVSHTDLVHGIAVDKDGIKITNASTGDYFHAGVSGVVTLWAPLNSKSIVMSPTDMLDDILINKDGIRVTNTSSGDYVLISTTGILSVFDNSGTKTLVIDPSKLTQNMSVITWDVCENGTPKKALFVSSDPFTP
jgi:hypothetical protein